MIHVFIVASKGIPAQYGGFETFVENLTKRKKCKEIKYHVSCMNNNEKNFIYNDADCFNVKVPLPGAVGRILHVGRVLNKVCKWVRVYNKKSKDDKVIVYILGCRVGPLLFYYARLLHKYDVRIMCNPDGLEWKRDKWNAIEKKFLKYCERCLVLNSDLAICDSKNIEKYILKTYPLMKNRTTYIAYGADVEKSKCNDEKLQDWYQKQRLSKQNYYLVVGRFVPENNYETIISEYMKSKTLKPLVIISNVENNSFYVKLKSITHFETDSRIKFVGTVYDQELLKKIREEAYAYIHGHEVGGTNPSLLEALASTKLNLLLDVGFNREVAEDTALYWIKDQNSLAALIQTTDEMIYDMQLKYSISAKKQIKMKYSWDLVVSQYEKLFCDLS